MPVCSWILSLVLVGQIGGASLAPANGVLPAAPSHGSGVPAAPRNITADAGSVKTGQSQAPSVRATTPQLVADALILPQGSTITGRPVSLVSVVATVAERSRQVAAVHAYWRLAEAVGEYHFAQDRQQRLSRLRAGNDEEAELRTARTSADAQLREAEVQVATAQHDLAETLLLTGGTPLPLPADQPLVGPYRTLFAQLFAGRNAPHFIRVLDQTLPLRQRAVEGYASALLAAEDALDAALELQAGGQERLASVLAALEAQVRQQRAFLAAVCRYNHDIADYALAVVSSQATPEVLVATLIKETRPPGQMTAPLPTTATLPTAYQQPFIGRGFTVGDSRPAYASSAAR